MVSRKRLDYNFYGYLLPPVPRALRTSKGRARVKISTEDRKICAFDLLATVAGLLEGEKTESSLKPKHTHDEKSSKSQAFVHESCSQNAFAISGYVQDDSVSSPATILATSESHEIDYGDGSVVEENNKNEVPCFLFKINTERNCDGGSPSSVESHCGEIEDKNGSFLGVEKKTIKLENPMPFQTEPSLLSSDSCANVPSCIDHIGYSSLPVNRNGMNLNCKDDDENSSLCTHPIILPNNLICRESNTSADQKKRKSGNPTSVKKDLSNPDIKSKPVLHGQKICYTRQRTQRCYPYKKRKNFILTNDGMSGKGVFSSPGKNMYKEALDSSISELQEIRPAVIVTGKEPLPEVGISHVKLSIKSFIIPEICIDIAQNATIGSLKSKVLDIVTTVLGGGGLQVGVLVKGKRIQDDSKTLFQNGICNDDALNNLDFTLEPISHLVSPSFRSEKPPLFLSCDETQSINRCMKPGSCDDTVELHLPSSSINFLERDRDYVSSLPDTRLEETPNSKALVTVPSTSMDSLALVPFNKKSTRSDVGQRRIRRPFSVSEVEALVQAVEKLGTGRWRDVKLCAFDNAKHRTYVDLKDKWKTLVHTARISPQQRRGEPVPQELLDRVLLAHAHWSQHTKHQSEPCSLS